METNEEQTTTYPTPEQIEAAALAFTCETREEWERSPDAYRDLIREDMRSALVAAAGAAPQEPSGCSNPECPLARAHSGPCAPHGWTPDRENLAAEGRLHAPVAVCNCQVGHPDDHPECRVQERFCERCDSDWPCLAKRATAALAAPAQVDEAKLTGMILGRTAPAAARAIAEWLRGGGQ